LAQQIPEDIWDFMKSKLLYHGVRIKMPNVYSFDLAASYASYAEMVVKAGRNLPNDGEEILANVSEGKNQAQSSKDLNGPD
jgi:hypothetical protein